MQAPARLSDPNDPGITRQVQGDALYIMGMALNLDQGDIPTTTPPDGVPVPGTLDVMIYADTVTLGGAVTNPGRKIQIVARQLIVGAGAAIDVSGVPGVTYAPGQLPNQVDETPGAAGVAGANGGTGGTGGSIVIQVAEMTGPGGAAPGTLTLAANGAAGGRGQDGAPGLTGAAGQAGVQQPGTEAPGWGGYGGAGGAPGQAGAGGAGGSIIVGVVQGSENPPVTCQVSGGGGGACGVGGQGGQGGPGIPPSYSNQPTPPGPNGPGGPWPFPQYPGPAGAAGAAGSTAIAASGQFTYAELSQATILPQLQMMQQQADTAFLGKDYAGAARLYALLIALTQGAVGAPSPTPDVAARAAVCQASLCELSRLRQGLDFFGLRANWAPALTLTLLQSEIQAMLDLSSQLQASLAILNNAAQSADQKRAALEAAQTQAAARLLATQAHIKAIDNQLTVFVESLGLQAAQISAQLVLIGTLQGELADDLFARDHPGCTTMHALSVCGTVISTGIAIDSGFEEVEAAGEALFEGGSLVDTVKNGMSLIQSVEASITSIQNGYATVSGAIDPTAHPDGGKLLTDEASYDAWVDQYIGQYAVAADLKSAVGRYFDLVKTRNGDVLAYNAAILQQARLQAEADQQTNAFESIAVQLASQNDPSNPAYTAFIQAADDQTRLYLLRRINDEVKAFLYWSVNDDQGGSGDPVAPPTDTQLPTLVAAHRATSAAISGWLDATGRPFEPFQGATITFTRADHPDAFQALATSTDRKLYVRSDIVADGASFANMYHVTAEVVRVILPDYAGQTTGVLTANVVHGGSGVFQQMDGATNVRFSHAIRPALYKHDYASGQDISPATLGDPSQGFTGLSPFCDWIIDLGFGNAFIDFDTLSSVELAFSGVYLGPQLRDPAGGGGQRLET